jgi:hypothetical protein
MSKGIIFSTDNAKKQILPIEKLNSHAVAGPG